MVITGISSPAFLFYRKDCKTRKSRLINKDCRVIEPYLAANQYMEFTNAIGLEGKFYAISRQGSLAVIEYKDDDDCRDYEITCLGKNRAVHKKASKHFREYLIEYKDESFWGSVDVVDDVEVFRLDKSRLFWEAVVEKLPEDAVFFVEDKCCLGIPASLLGCKSGSNCIYFTHSGVESWILWRPLLGVYVINPKIPQIKLPFDCMCSKIQSQFAGESMGLMKKKTKKKERKSSQNKVGGQEQQTPWLNLPFTGYAFRRRQKIIMDHISGAGGVTKSWLVQINIPPDIKQTPVPKNWDYWNHCKSAIKGYSHKIEVVLYTNSMISCNGKDIRWIPSVPFRVATFSSVPDYWKKEGRGNCILSLMVVTGISSPAFSVYIEDCYTKKYRWINKDCRVIEPYSAANQYMEFTNAIGLEGKFYAISRQGSLAKHFREYLIEYKGGIFLVLLVSRGSVDVVDDVEVFRLDKSRLFWETAVEKLPEDAVFFVEDKCCLGIPASLLGCKSGSNCIYFTHSGVESWFRFDMETSCITATAGPELELDLLI
ncbi:50S ribosomal protein L28 [Striga asiatica]|uniref:50S ribosomal protein L28 n=1 Tax=Striga asiatica TaxID=4170 RepID=A0A5A7PTB6_STRAF|nr:50S ribosomal protein L28 [Striga asiatica]